MMYTSHLLGEPTTIFVGAEKAKFIIATDLLVSKGGSFFEKALLGPFKEAESTILELPEEDPCAFELFINYLFFDSVPDITILEQHTFITFQQMEASEDTCMIAHEAPWHRLVQMANKFLLDDLRLCALTCIRDYHHATRTVCHPRLLIEDYNKWAPLLRGTGADQCLEAYATEQLRSAKRADPEQYEFFIDHFLEHRPDVLGSLLKTKQVWFLAKNRVPSSEKRNGFGTHVSTEPSGKSVMIPTELLVGGIARSPPTRPASRRVVGPATPFGAIH